MSRITILNSNSQGMVTDLDPTTMTLEQWTWIEGARVESGRVKRFRGPEPVGLLVAPAPTGIFQYRRGDRANSLFFVSEDAIWFTEGEPAIDVSSATAPYEASPNGWTFVNFNGVPILNPATEVPQAGESFPLAAVVDLSNWPSGWLAGSIRSFKTLLIAMNLTVGGVEKPQQFAHSNLVEDPFVVPADWDFADPTSVAGINVLSDIEGPIIDGMQLRELFVMYKDRQAYVLTLGGQNVFSIFATFSKGLIAKNCIAVISTPEGPRHFCVGQDDIYLSTGHTEQSVGDDRVCDWFFENLTVGLESHVHVKHHPPRHEVAILFPLGPDATGCTHALVYNYRRPAFYLWPLEAGVVTFESSLFNISADPNPTWDADSQDWDDDPSRWDAFPSAFGVSRLTTVDGGALVYLDEAETCDTPTTVTRTGLAITGKDYRGNLTYDPDVYKYVNDIWPRFRGAGVVSVEMLVQELSDGPTTSQGPWTFAVGDRRVENTYGQGRLIGFQFESTDSAYWEMIGYDIDLVTGGS